MNERQLFQRDETFADRRLQLLAREAYRVGAAFRLALEVDAYRRRDSFAGSETYVYAIAEASGEAIKFGLAVKPLDRLSTLQQATHRELLLYAASPGTPALERYLHQVLRRERLRGEWFRPGHRALIVADLVRSAEEQCAEIVRYTPGYDVDSRDTLAVFYGRIEDALARAAA